MQNSRKNEGTPCSTGFCGTKPDYPTRMRDCVKCSGRSETLNSVAHTIPHTFKANLFFKTDLCTFATGEAWALSQIIIIAITIEMIERTKRMCCTTETNINDEGGTHDSRRREKEIMRGWNAVVVVREA